MTSANGNQKVISNIRPTKFLISSSKPVSPQFFLSWNKTMIYPGITLDICFSFTLCHPHQSVGSVNSTFEMEHKSIKIPISPPQFKFKLPIFLADYFNRLLISLCINTCPLQPFSTQQNDHTKTLIILCSFHV